MSKVVIIGSGPAGISASLYTARAGIETLIISKGSGSLKKADKIENYYGFTEAISGEELEKNGIEGAKKIGVQFVNEEVTGLTFEESLVVKTNDNSHKADAVIIATGTSRTTPKISGLKEYEGKGVSYCAVCDGFFYRNKDVAVIGNGKYAVNEAKELLPMAASVTILTNGDNIIENVPNEIRVITNKIQEINGDDVVNKVIFTNGEILNVNGIFVAVGVAGSTDLARKLGAVIDKNKIVVDEKMATNIPSLFAAGDCTGGLLQVSKAVSDGAIAGTNAVKYIRALNK